MEEEWWQDAILLRDIFDPEGDPSNYTGLTYAASYEDETRIRQIDASLLLLNSPRVQNIIHMEIEYHDRKLEESRQRRERYRAMIDSLTPIELKFWEAAKSLRLPELAGMVPQYKVLDYRLDFAIPSLEFGIELDGHATHSSTKAIAHDRYRQRRLDEAGWYIIRFGGSEVHHNAEGCVREVARVVREKRR